MRAERLIKILCFLFIKTHLDFRAIVKYLGGGTKNFAAFRRMPFMMTQLQLQTILQGVKDIVRTQYRAELKGVFGSFARGEAALNSDVDILVEFEKGATLLHLAGLGNFLEEKLHRKVDIVTPAAIRKELRTQIYNDMVYL